MPRARFNDGAEPANHTKKIIAKSENVTALLFFPNTAPAWMAARLTSETCIPERAKIWASPAFRKAEAQAPSKKSLFAESRASAKPPAAPHPANRCIRAKRSLARTAENGERHPKNSGISGSAKKRTGSVFFFLSAKRPLMERVTPSAKTRPAFFLEDL